MTDPQTPDPKTPSVLEQISTRWPLISDPGQFVLRYAPAIRRYLGAMLRASDVVEEVIQDFFLRVLQHRFTPEQVSRGRFRDYLKATVRNAALTHWRRKPPPTPDEEAVRRLAVTGGADAEGQ